MLAICSRSSRMGKRPLAGCREGAKFPSPWMRAGCLGECGLAWVVVGRMGARCLLWVAMEVGMKARACVARVIAPTRGLCAYGRPGE